jgi:hypothetical protein
MLKKVISHESGQALVWTLVILGVGALLIPALLSYINTNLLASRTIEEGLKEQYAADAGVEYALHRLANDDCPDVPFDTPTAVNNMPVTVTVESEDVYYKITSTAKDTVISSYVEYSPGGNLDLYKGALVASGNIDLARDCTVDGDIRYGGTFDPGNNFNHVSGDVIPGAIGFPPSNEFAQTYIDEALVGGTHTGDLDICTGTLGPKYIADGNLNVGMYCVITLMGTIYVERAIDVGKDGEFKGSGSIVAVGDIYLSKMGDYGTATGDIIMSLTGDITFKKETEVNALIYAPNGTIKFDKECTVIGGVVAKNIQADKLNLFAYDASFYDGFELPGYEDPGFSVRTYNINP